jgi:hypothetical protein
MAGPRHRDLQYEHKEIMMAKILVKIKAAKNNDFSY